MYIDEIRETKENHTKIAGWNYEEENNIKDYHFIPLKLITK